MNKSWLGKDKKAIALLRVSGQGQEHNTSRVTQKVDCERYCREHDLQLIEVVPIVESASKSKLRRKYNAVLGKAKKLGIRHIIFHKYDREARNLTDNESNENLVRNDEFVLHYVADQKILHKDSPDTDFLMRDYHAVQNKHYSRDLSTKVRKATQTKAESGWYPGCIPPLGYRNEKLKTERGHERRRGSIIVKDFNPKIVKQIQREFELRAQIPTPSLREIRRQIIDEGFIPLNEIKKYHAGSLDRRLRNPFYDGRFIWHGTEYKGKHERIISHETFWRVQATFGIKNPYGRNSDALFGNGWLTCADSKCGCNIVYDPVVKTIKETGEKKTFKYYHCTNGKRVHLSLKGMRVSEENLLEQFRPAASEVDIREDFRDELIRALNETQMKGRNAIKRDIENYKAALAVLREKENRAYDRYDNGEIDRDTYNQQRTRLQGDQQTFTDMMEKAQLQITDAANVTVRSILQLATNAESLWKTRTPQEQRLFLNELLSNQVLDGVTVRYEIIKPLRTLSEMKTDQNWRRG